MCQRIGIENVCRNPIRILVLIVPEHVLISCFTGADDDKLGELVGNAVGDPVYQVQTLLIGQTGNNRDHELVLVLRQPQFFLESQLCLLFLFHSVLDGIVYIDLFVGLGIVDLVVNAVQDTAERTGACTEQTV